MFLGRRKPYPGSLLSPSSWRETLAKCVVQPHGGTSRRQGSQNTLPEANAARPDPQRKKNGKHPLLGRVCLLTTGGLMRVRRYRLCRDRTVIPLAWDGLIERIPPICCSDACLDLADHRAPAIAVGHDDHTIPLPDVRHEIAAKAPVAPTVAHVPALAAFVHCQSNSERSYTDWCDHLPCHRLRQDAAG